MKYRFITIFAIAGLVCSANASVVFMDFSSYSPTCTNGRRTSSTDWEITCGGIKFSGIAQCLSASCDSNFGGCKSTTTGEAKYCTCTIIKPALSNSYTINGATATTEADCFNNCSTWCSTPEQVQGQTHLFSGFQL